MKANTIRLGNLIINKTGNIQEVFTLYEESINGYDGNAGIVPDGEEDFEGIKLTEKWIIDLGLKRMPESEYTLDSYDLAGFRLWMYRGSFLFNDRINIEYVHELQNLFFALTGIELTLKNK